MKAAIPPLSSVPETSFGVLRCLAVAVAALVFCCGWPAVLQQAETPRLSHNASIKKARWAIRENGYFRADLGRYFQEGDRLDVYTSAREFGAVWDSVQQRYVLLKELSLLWKGEPYYHEGYQLQNGEWVRKEIEFSKEPDRYLDFGPCDAQNTLEIPDDPLATLDFRMRRVLPRGAKIKAVSEFKGDFVTVVYSKIPTGLPSIYEPGAYPIYVALLVLDKQSWQIVETLRAEEWAYFCGTRTLSTQLANGGTAAVLLLYSGSPQGTRVLSVSRGIHSYLLTKTPD